MTKAINIDFIVLMLLPIGLVICTFFKQDNISYYGFFLIIALGLYELMVYPKREMFGFSGIKIVAIPSLALLTFTLFIGLPAIYIVSIHPTIAGKMFFFSVLSFYILFPLGLLFGHYLKPLDRDKYSAIFSQDFFIISNEIVIFEALIVIYISCIGIFLLYLSQTPIIPLIELIRHPGDLSMLTMAREEAFKLLKISVFERYLFTWLRSLLLPIGTVGSFYLWLVSRENRNLVLSILYALTGLLVNSITLEKSPTAALMLTIIVLFYLKKGKLNLKFIAVSFLIVFTVPFFIMIMLHSAEKNFLYVVWITFLYRIFIVPAEVLYHYFEIFPDIHEFLLGRSSQVFSWLYYDGTFPLSNYVARIWWRAPQATTLANANYIGYFWADFGFWGVVVSTFLVGLVIYMLFWLLISASRYKKNFLYVVSVSVMAPIFTFVFFSSNFTTLFFTRGLIFFILIFMMVLYTNRVKEENRIIFNYER